MEDNRRYLHDAVDKNEKEVSKTTSWKKVGLFFIALVMAMVTVFVMNI